MMRGLIFLMALLWGGSVQAQQYWTPEQINAGRQAAFEAREAQIARRFDAERARFRLMLETALGPEATADVLPAHRAEVAALKDGCRGGDLDACIGLAQVFAAGRVVPRDAPLAVAVYWLGCDAGHDASCRSYNRSSHYVTAIPRSNLDPAMPWRHARCAQGDPEACLDLAGLYSSAENFLTLPENSQTNDALSAQFLERACALGARAAYTCKFVKGDRQDPPQPTALAISAWDTGCTKGVVVDCLGLAQAVTPTDPDRAISLAARACRLGVGDDCNMVVYELLSGTNRADHQLLLVEMLELLCGDGHVNGCKGLADLYRDGPDAIRDPARAQYWTRQACHHNPEEWEVPLRDCFEAADLPFDALAPAVDAMVLPGLRPVVTQAREGCVAGDAEACHDLATIAQEYKAVPLLLRASQDLHARACALGAAAACPTPKPASREGGNAPSSEEACATGDDLPCAMAIAAQTTRTPQDRLYALQARCAAGSGPACGLVGGLYSGQKIPDSSAKPWAPDSDWHLAADFYRMGCDLDDGASCAAMAEITQPKRNPTRTERSLQGTAQEAYLLYAKGCQLKDLRSCSMASALADDPHAAFRHSLQACRIGEVSIGCDGVLSAALNLTLSLRIAQQGALAVALAPDLGLEKQHAAGTLRRLQRGCASRTTADCMALAELFGGQSASGPAMHYAVQYWDLVHALHRHACALGQGDGCAELAEAVRWDRASDPLGEKGLNALGCARGSAAACYAAAGNWADHSDTPDPARELQLTEKACRLSDRRDCHLLADVMRRDAGAVYDQQVMRCLDGEAIGCYLAGRRDDVDGKPVPEDVKQALLDYGCRFGSQDACEALALRR